MKSLPLAFCSFFLTASLQAFAPHPSVLTVQYKDKLVPVLKVIGTDPVVMVDGAEKRVRTDPLYLVQRTDAFAEGEVKQVSIKLGGTSIGVVANVEDAAAGMGPTGGGGTSYFEATLRSKNTLNGGFAVVVIYALGTDNGHYTLYSGTQVIVHGLPDLPAGKDVPVQFSAALPDSHHSLSYFLQIFDNTGREVLSSNMEPAWQYYMVTERVQLATAVKRYVERHAGENHSVTPVLMPKPIFKDGLAAPTGESAAVLDITADGTVSRVEITGELAPAARASIVDALGGWLFYPELKAGDPVATRVKLPLKF